MDEMRKETKDGCMERPNEWQYEAAHSVHALTEDMPTMWQMA